MPPDRSSVGRGQGAVRPHLFNSFHAPCARAKRRTGAFPARRRQAPKGTDPRRGRARVSVPHAARLAIGIPSTGPTRRAPPHAARLEIGLPPIGPAAPRYISRRSGERRHFVFPSLLLRDPTKSIPFPRTTHQNGVQCSAPRPSALGCLRSPSLNSRRQRHAGSNALGLVARALATVAPDSSRNTVSTGYALPSAVHLAPSPYCNTAFPFSVISCRVHMHYRSLYIPRRPRIITPRSRLP